MAGLHGDEYFKTVMVLKDKAGDHPEAVRIRASVFRALQRPEKLAFARAVVRTTRQVRVQTKPGLRLGRRVAFDVDLGRLDRVVARITQGLFWHHQRLRIPDGFEVAVYSQGTSLRGLDAQKIEQWQSHVVIPVLNNPLHSIGRGVMRYRYAFASDRQHVSSWIYEFYEDVRFVALVMPTGAGRMGSEEPVHPL